MKLYGVNANFNGGSPYAESDVEVTLETAMSFPEYKEFYATNLVQPYQSKEYMLVTKSYIDEQINKRKNEEKKSGAFGGYFSSDGKDVYITKVIYNKPAVIVFWSDNTKTRATCDEEDIWNTELGLSLCVMKKLVGQDSVSKLIKDWSVASSPVEIADTDDRRPAKVVTLKDVRKNHKEEKEAEKFAKRLF